MTAILPRLSSRFLRAFVALSSQRASANGGDGGGATNATKDPHIEDYRLLYGGHLSSRYSSQNPPAIADSSRSLSSHAYAKPHRGGSGGENVRDQGMRSLPPSAHPEPDHADHPHSPSRGIAVAIALSVPAWFLLVAAANRFLAWWMGGI